MPPILPAPSTATRTPAWPGGSEPDLGFHSFKGYQTLRPLSLNPHIHSLLQHPSATHESVPGS
jgi:hypothetical protein